MWRPLPRRRISVLGGRPFPDIGMDFADGFRIGLPFFLPIGADAADERKQLVDNVSTLAGDHLVKAGIEVNQTGVSQQFVGFGNSRYIFDSVDGFINFIEQGNRYVTCSDGSTSAAGVCPPGAEITGPVLLYLQARDRSRHPRGGSGQAGLRCRRGSLSSFRTRGRRPSGWC